MVEIESRSDLLYFQLTLHIPHQAMLVSQSVVRPLLSEGDLDTVLHLHVVNLGKAPDEEVHHYQSGII